MIKLVVPWDVSIRIFAIEKFWLKFPKTAGEIVSETIDVILKKVTQILYLYLHHIYDPYKHESLNCLDGDNFRFNEKAWLSFIWDVISGTDAM